ncbi:MAG: FecR domain-containing protein, partial [Lachnospiraceae bacterium]|nr:FecR domain-containing protein [Lachnospiraceae bacterium]
MGAEKNVRPIAKKPVIIGASIAAVAVIAVVAAILLNLNRITAISIRIQRLVGTVNLYDEKGKEKSMIEKMRLNSGHSLKTAVESLVMVSLDESRLLTLEEASQAKIKAKGKQLEFNLTSGSLFFNVNEKLEDDETFDIRTSTMVCGIRGTSAFIGKDSKGHETVMVTDGTVHVVAENPRTHEITEVDVNAGEMITIYLDEEAEGDATISIKKENFR